MAPKGEADRGGSAGASFHKSLGENVEAVEDSEVFRAPGAGLNIVAFALSFGDVEGEPPFSLIADGVVSLARLDMVRCMVGVGGPEPLGTMGMDGDCGRPSGVRARYDGTRVGANGRNEWLELREGEARARDGVRWGAYGFAFDIVCTCQHTAHSSTSMRVPFLRCMQSRQTWSIKISSYTVSFYPDFWTI